MNLVEKEEKYSDDEEEDDDIKKENWLIICENLIKNFLNCKYVKSDSLFNDLINILFLI